MKLDIPSPFQGGGSPGALQQFISKPRHNNIQFGTGVDLYQHPEMANPRYAQSSLMQQLMQKKMQQQALMQQAQQSLPLNNGIPPGDPRMSAMGPMMGGQPTPNPNDISSQRAAQIAYQRAPFGASYTEKPEFPGQIASVEVGIPGRNAPSPMELESVPLNNAVLGKQKSLEKNPKTFEILKKYGIQYKPKSSENDPKGYKQIALDAAVDAGIPASYLPKVLGVESGGNPNAVSPTGAKGLYQFTKSTWNYINKKYDLGLTNPMDPVQNTKAAAYLAKENAQALEKYNLPVNDTNLYITHNIGAGGAKKLLNADPMAKVNEVLDMVLIKNNPIFFKAKGGGWNTVGDALGKYQQYIGD